MTRRSCLAAVMACVVFTATAGWAEQLYQYTPKSLAPDEKGAGSDGVMVKEIPIQKGDTLYGLSRKYGGKGFYYPQILLFNDIKDPDRIFTGEMIRVPLGQNVSNHTENEGPVPETAKPKDQTASGKQKHKKTVHAAVPANAKKSPVPKQTAPTAELSLSDLKHLDGTKTAQRTPSKRAARISKKQDRPSSTSHLQEDIKPAVQLSQDAPVAQAPVKQEDSPALNTSAQKMYERAVKAFRQDNFKSALEYFERFLSENPTSPLAADANLYKAECYLKLSGL